MKKYYYNYRRNEAELDEGIIFCANDPYSSAHYGKIQRIFQATSSTLIGANEELKKLAEEFYKLSWEDLEISVYPEDIVEFAGVWQDLDFINFLEYNNFFDNCDGIVIPDGAIFFEVNEDNLVETNYL